MANDLTVSGSNSQAQTATQDPQASVPAPNTGTASSSVQQGTAESLLNGQTGVPLNGTALSTVNLNPNPAATTTQTAVPAHTTSKHHHTNPILFGVAVLLLLVAIVLFWLTSRSVKSTT